MPESPRAWGWTDGNRFEGTGRDGIPTRVGMDRWAATWSTRTCWNPHARGDGPHDFNIDATTGKESPRAWGWTDELIHSPPWNTESPRAWGWTGRRRDQGDRILGIPTRVGMDRRHRRRRGGRRWNPHARGDGPGYVEPEDCSWMESPRAWGWTGPHRAHAASQHGIPTRVGMDRDLGPRSRNALRNPHARGDGPRPSAARSVGLSESPRAWGWTGLSISDSTVPSGIPTRVGMDRSSRPCARSSGRNPHARGDGPADRARRKAFVEESPRAWGWTGFWGLRLAFFARIPTRVGTDPVDVPLGRRFGRNPRARGDGPPSATCHGARRVAVGEPAGRAARDPTLATQMLWPSRTPNAAMNSAASASTWGSTCE